MPEQGEREGGITGASKINLQFHGDPFPLFFRALQLFSRHVTRIFRVESARERERDGKKKHSISHWLWRLTAVRRGSHSYCARVIIIVTHGKGSNELAHSFRIPFSHPGNLINRERKIIILYSFDGAIVPDSTDPWDVCLPGRFDGIISRKKERKKKRKKKNGTLISTSLRRLQAPAPQVVP